MEDLVPCQTNLPSNSTQEMVINPAHQELDQLHWVLAWRDVMSLNQVGPGGSHMLPRHALLVAKATTASCVCRSSLICLLAFVPLPTCKYTATVTAPTHPPCRRW